jgi:hypothetical protein
VDAVIDETTDFYWSLGSRGTGYFEISDDDGESILEGTLEWAIWDMAEAELVEATIEAFGRTYDVTLDVRAMIDPDALYEAAYEAKLEDLRDAESMRADLLIDEWKERRYFGDRD